MGFFNADAEQMLHIFQSETQEQMEEFDRHLIEAEKQGQLSSSEINSLFRIVHTIKSSSAMMGMDFMSSCTHRMEEIFIIFREDEESSLGHEKDFFALMYEYSDFIRDEMSRVLEPDYEPRQSKHLLEQIEDGLEKLQKKEHKEQLQKGSFRVLFQADCQMEQVRAYMLVQRLKPLCQKLESVPANLETEEAAVLIREKGLLLRFTTGQMTEVLKKLKESPFLSGVMAEENSQDRDGGQKKEENAGAGKGGRYGFMERERLNQLQNITGELITADSILEELQAENKNFRQLEEFSLLYRRLLAELDEVVTSIALTPVSSITSQLHRLVRDISKKEGKQVNFTVKGEDIEVDKNMMDLMLPSFFHLLRNAVDHGIEGPQQRLAAGKEQAGQVCLEVSAGDGMVQFRVTDDGSGLNPQALLKQAAQQHMLVKPESEYTEAEIMKFILLPGFSTSTQVNEFSGRGVGMDVVRDAVDSVSGVLTVKSEAGKGSCFEIQMPVSMTAVETIRFQSGPHICLLPVRSIERIYSWKEAGKNIKRVYQSDYFNDGQLVPVIRLSTLFKEEESEPDYLIVMRGVEGRLGLLIGEIYGEQLSVEKPLPALFGKNYRRDTGISGCAILGNGKIGLMLNADKLLRARQKGIEDDARAERYSRVH